MFFTRNDTEIRSKIGIGTNIFNEKSIYFGKKQQRLEKKGPIRKCFQWAFKEQ